MNDMQLDSALRQFLSNGFEDDLRCLSKMTWQINLPLALNLFFRLNLRGK